MKSIIKKTIVFFIFSLLLIFIVAGKSEKQQKFYSYSKDNTLRYISPIFDSIEIVKDILFAEVINEKKESEKLCLDIYTPKGDTVEKRPVILWVHGGGFTEGTKTQGYIKSLAYAFAQRGYVSVSANYRLRQNPKEDMTGTINDAMEDIMEALDWMRENNELYGINKNCIVIGGGSAGGILSTNLCYKDATIASPWDKNGLIAFVNLWGSPDKLRMDKIIDVNDPPTIFIHGTADSIVPYSNCQWISVVLDSVGVKNKVYAIEGAGHTPTENIEEIVENIAAFLYLRIKEIKD